MPRHFVRSLPPVPSHDRTGLYQEITDKIIADLERGSVPWAQSWQRSEAPLGLPRNASTGRRYSGVNVLLLWDALISRGYSSQRWLTFRQALTLGGSIRKGEKGTTIVYADRVAPRRERVRAERDDITPGTVSFLKRSTVFNIDQCDGCNEARLVEPVQPELILPIADALILATGAQFGIGGDRAYYDLAHDVVHVPRPETYFESINWHRTAFHELSHWTGHASRLGRDFSNDFGPKAYAKEELVAEMAGSFVCATLGIAPAIRHADYIGTWLEILREDNRAVVRAASAASKAAEFLAAFQPST
jgi:antirestriction protein ArdC